MQVAKSREKLWRKAVLNQILSHSQRTFARRIQSGKIVKFANAWIKLNWIARVSGRIALKPHSAAMLYFIKLIAFQLPIRALPEGCQETARRLPGDFQKAFLKGILKRLPQDFLSQTLEGSMQASCLPFTLNRKSAASTGIASMLTANESYTRAIHADHNDVSDRTRHSTLLSAAHHAERPSALDACAPAFSQCSGNACTAL